MPKNNGTRNRQYEADIQKAIADGSLFDWARSGATDNQIAEYLGIGRSTFYRAMNEITDFRDTIKAGRKPIVSQAFGKLIHLAYGFYYDETEDEEKEVLDRNGNIVTLHTRKTKHLYSKPDNTALSRVIMNYQKKDSDGVEGIPKEYISAPVVQIQNHTGRLEELDSAMRALFFGEGESEVLEQE